MGLLTGRDGARGWFGSRRRRGAGTLDVRLGLRSRRGPDLRWVASLAMAALAAAAAAGVVWLGVWFLLQKAFVRNPRFAITRLDVRSGGAVVEGYLRGRAGIREGVNLFAFDARRTRDEFLRVGHAYRSMSITRRLPGTVVVDVTHRVPLARVGETGNFVVDETGRIFNSPSGYGALPVIRGLRAPLAPGSVADRAALAALQVLDACADPRLGMQIEGVSVASADYLVLDCAGHKTIRFWWPEMGTRTVESRRAMLRKLARLSRVLQSSVAERHGAFDATSGDIVGK